VKSRGFGVETLTQNPKYNGWELPGDLGLEVLVIVDEL